MKWLDFLGVWSPAYIGLFTSLRGQHRVGEDSFGNIYYRTRPRKGYALERRWVMYKGDPEPSTVPPEWHAWLHHQSDEIPASQTTSFRQPWQKPHRPNLTGTGQAYRPPGHLLRGGKRDHAYGDYEAWSPDTLHQHSKGKHIP